jgi:hypothetical protein
MKGERIAMNAEQTNWLLESPEPWMRYRTLADLLDRPEPDPEMVAARREMVTHPQVQALIAAAATWGERALKRHNDASHPLYALSTLADFGLRADDPGMGPTIEKVLTHQSPEGPFQTLVFIPRAFGGPDEDLWTWVACDAPTLLYSLLAFGLGDDPRVQGAAEHLTGLAQENGYRCAASSDLGRFKGPGKREDPCPIANVYALKALSLTPEHHDGPAARQAAEMLLGHWERQKEHKYFLFGVGSDFRKLKYPFVWYDILHVTEVLSRFSFVHADPRFQEMIATITAQANGQGRYTATSMYRAWKGWSFADKKAPSPWLTFVVLRILKRIA